MRSGVSQSPYRLQFRWVAVTLQVAWGKGRAFPMEVGDGAEPRLLGRGPCRVPHTAGVQGGLKHWGADGGGLHAALRDTGPAVETVRSQHRFASEKGPWESHVEKGRAGGAGARGQLGGARDREATWVRHTA